VTRLRVMHLIDTLEAGGAERVAVNLANLLAAEGHDVSLCATRREGPLSSAIVSAVRRVCLRRSHSADLGALRHLVAHNQAHRVEILHAHSTSVFLASVAAAFPPYPAVIWHDHYGSGGIRERSAWIYRAAMRTVAAVIAVNEMLRDWAIHRLRVPEDRVWYVPNFVCSSPANPIRDLPGTAGFRLVSVANFRPQKDHLVLIAALAAIVRAEPRAHLLLVGASTDRAYLARIQEALRVHGVVEHVTILGERRDVAAILHGCDVAVLSSRSEGLPLAVLEYGAAGRAVVATNVGQVGEVLDGGRAGRLVAPGSPDDLAAAILALLGSPAERDALGQRLMERVAANYRAGSAIRRETTIYESVLERRARAA
jgi:glycosyltransferase involved in cell wall biosynthesis